MLWEGRQLRDIREADVRHLVETGLEEHLQLEYKGELYGENQHSRREFLLDVCMFANAAGGILLMGIPERRDGNGRPTGAPDPEGPIGIVLDNYESVLAGYDARVMEAIEERLPLESSAIDVGGGRRVLAIRVTNSTRKPHSVRHDSHIYFPSRRQRQRYYMTVREIKDVVMRTASRVEEAKELLRQCFFKVVRLPDAPYLIMGIIPAFFEDFSVDIKVDRVVNILRTAVRAGETNYVNPVYTFDGLERCEGRFDYRLMLQRNGLLRGSMQLSNHVEENRHLFVLSAMDKLIRRFALNATRIYEAAQVGPPYTLGMMLRTSRPLAGVEEARLGGPFGQRQLTEEIATGDYLFPYAGVEDLSDIDRITRPFCDQTYQMFGLNQSPQFDETGAWRAGSV
jgi:schlafen family protein